jgi:predicted SprT family Zn-dependent metalloprotease
MTTPQQQVLTRCKEILAKAETMYGVDMSHVSIRFDLRGRAAGQAGRRGSHYFMRFNNDMLGREAFDHVFNDTVPHEIAHIVCYMKPTLGHGHDYGWARVCRALGGTGKTYHQEEVVYGKGVTYEYTSTTGHKTRVSQVLHGKIQRGVEYTYRGGKGKLNKTCTFSIVGIQGKTLAQPIVKKPAATLATPAPAVRIPVHIPHAVYVTPPVTAAPAVPNAYVRPAASESKAATARRIMLAGYRSGQAYEDIISAIMQATGHDRQLARATYKANAAKVGITE